MIRLFVKLAGQLVAPRGPLAHRWAPRELFSPRLTRAIITDLIKMKSETGHVGAAAASPRGGRTIITETVVNDGPGWSRA